MADAAPATATEVKYRMKDGKQVLDKNGKPIPIKVSPFKKLAQFQTPDGKIFQTQREASEHLRVHLVVDALNKVAGGDANLGKWLLENRDAIRKAFDAAKVERPPVTEETKAKMKAAREKIGQKKAEVKK